MIITNKNEEFERNYAIYDDLMVTGKGAIERLDVPSWILHKEVVNTKAITTQ